MPNKLFGKSQVMQAAERIDLKLADKVVAVDLKNQGTAILKSGLNSKAITKTLPNATNPYGGVEGYYLEGYIEIDFESAGTPECVATIYSDKGPTEDC